MQLDHLSPSIYHNLLFIIIILVLVIWITNHLNNPSNALHWFKRGLWIATLGVIIILGSQIGVVGHRDYINQTKQYQKTRQTNVVLAKNLQQKVITTQNEIAFWQIKANQPNQSDKQIRADLDKMSRAQIKLSTIKTKLKTAQANVAKIKPNGVPN